MIEKGKSKKVCSGKSNSKDNLKFGYKTFRIYSLVKLTLGISLFRATTAVFAFQLVQSIAVAGINSGGGCASGGAYSNLAAIGGLSVSMPAHGLVPTNHSGLIQVIYPVVPASITDVDGNGIADGWEVGCFGSLGVDPAADADCDDTSNLMEYLAKTDPKGAGSRFSPQSLMIDRVFHIVVPTAAGRNYQIWASRDLRNWTSQEIIVGNGSVQHFIFDTTKTTPGPLGGGGPPSSCFFRIQIIIP